ncbi:MAG: phosphotransferase [Candidatus Moranbacteria bacterium]|nr:phosphotransferase [Candidatus Moranbacteria bacterium]
MEAIGKNRDMSFPKRIGRYRFREEMTGQDGDSRYRFGIYHDQEGALALLKTPADSSDRTASRWLRNEITAYRFVSGSLAKRPELYDLHPDIRVPDLIAAESSRQRSYLLIRYVSDAKRLSDLPAGERVDAYRKAIAFLSEFSSVDERRNTGLLRRGQAYLSFSFPLIAVVAIVFHPRAAFAILGAMILYFRYPPRLRDGERNVFAHRDLGERNILADGQRYWIVDFQLAAFAHPLTDIVALALKLWDNRAEWESFLAGEAVSRSFSRPHGVRDVRSLSLRLCVQNLAISEGRDPVSVTKYLRRLLHHRPSPFRQRLCQLKGWVYGLLYSSKKRVRIEPFDPKGEEIARAVIQEIRAAQPDDVTVHLLGSVSMGIAGRRDIDIFVECDPDAFRPRAARLSEAFGPSVRTKPEYVEWEFVRDGWEIDILLIDPESAKFGYQTSVVWMVQQDPVLRSRYDVLKRSLDGKTLREYEQAKRRFFSGLRKESLRFQDSL